MQALPKSRLLRFVEQAFHLAQRAVARYSSKFSKRRYTLHQHIVLLCLKVRENTTYRTLLDELIEMPRIRNAINLDELPSPSTLCKAFNRLDMAVWRVLLTLSVTLLPTNGIVGINASGFDRSHASKHYTKRTKLTIQQLKVTLLVDTRSNAIIDVHVTTTRKHDSNASTVRSSGHGSGGNSFENSLSPALLTISTDHSNIPDRRVPVLSGERDDERWVGLSPVALTLDWAAKHAVEELEVPQYQQ